MFCESVIVAGMLLDTIMPVFGFNAFPGSTLSQLFGVLLLYRIYLFINKNKVKLENVSEFVYYSVKSPILIYDYNKKLRIVNKSATDFLKISEQNCENVLFTDLFEMGNEKLKYGAGRMVLTAGLI